MYPNRSPKSMQRRRKDEVRGNKTTGGPERPSDGRAWWDRLEGDTANRQSPYGRSEGLKPSAFVKRALPSLQPPARELSSLDPLSCCFCYSLRMLGSSRLASTIGVGCIPIIREPTRGLPTIGRVRPHRARQNPQLNQLVAILVPNRHHRCRTPLLPKLHRIHLMPLLPSNSRRRQVILRRHFPHGRALAPCAARGR